MIYSMIYTPRKLVATEAVLTRLAEAARLGLLGDNLAYAAGMTPLELRQLQEFDPAVNHAIGYARAQSEAEMAQVVYDDAKAGNAKAALDMLKHKHDWVAKQQVNVDVNQTISITQALQEANNRAIEANFDVIDDGD